MGLINYKEIGCKQLIDKTTETFIFHGKEIQVAKHLSTSDKYDLIMITLQKSLDKNIYNPLKLDVFFDLNIIYLYTNIVFDAEERADEAALYDALKQSGLIDAVKAKINTEELEALRDYVSALVDIMIKYRNTFGAVVGSFIEQLPANMEQAKEIIGEFDASKYQELLKLASQLKAGTLLNN